MSSNDEKYQKKYLKYKKKYIALKLELQQNGGGSILNTIQKGFRSAASTAASAASNPAVQAATLTAASIAAQHPDVQAKLSQVQQKLDNSPNAQFLAQIAKSHPTVQSAMAHPTAQQAMNIAKAATSGEQTPNSIWNNLTLDQKQKLIAMLQFIK